MKKRSTAAVTAALCIFCAVLTVFSKAATNAAATSLTMCLKCLIPSLFPYMVASSMLVSCGAAESLGRVFPVAKIFGINKRASGAIILGALCGFPLGAKIAVDFYKQGVVSKEEAEALISVSNNTGPSFVVAVIGAGFWKSAAFGWKLYFFQIFSALVAGLIVNRIVMPPKKCGEFEMSSSRRESFSVVFTKAVTDSVSAVLSVCGFVMFFAVLGAYLKVLTDAVSPMLTGTVFSVLELTGASEYAAMIASGNLAAGGFLAGFAVGFSGLSVFCQAASFTVPSSLSMKRTFAVKSIQGVICGALCAAAAVYEDIQFSQTAASFEFATVPAALAVAVFILFALKNARRA